EQIKASAELGVEVIEIHTGDYALADALAQPEKLLEIRSGIAQARELGLVVNVGHGLDLNNVLPIVRIPEVNEFNIGFSIIARSIEVGLESAIKEMLALIRS
ncbi:MAG: pyridoxine 5'-phosphate synthase, partial [Candidatus Omnitrophica bacterium]|nr:pyridoxine 5'-phosphate synthase [Candidatus Omnitrophota bacterium]